MHPWINVLRHTDEVNTVAIIINEKTHLSWSSYDPVKKVREYLAAYYSKQKVKIFIKWNTTEIVPLQTHLYISR